MQRFVSAVLFCLVVAACVGQDIAQKSTTPPDPYKSTLDRLQSLTHVWVGDQIAGKASIKSIRLGQATQGNLVEVVDGLTPADKLISGGREGLTNGQRIVITEDSAPVDLPTREQHGKPARRPQ